MAIVTILRQPLLHGFELLAQAAHLLTVSLDHAVLLGKHLLQLLNEFVSLRQLFPQHSILFSQRHQFFFKRHICTLPDLTSFGKPVHTWAVTNSSSYRYNSDSLRISFLGDQMSRTVNKKEEHEEVLRGGRQRAQRFPCVAILRAQSPTLSLPSPSSGRDV